ncbi:MAG: hypothetical protein KJ904_18600 [Alphaproteobacteria bacterium]|nr:hypothetical protein [Alphaproteobacteria bacterium]MBU0796312.1 hypothetical protein [Alphaproteobacteria bacterium]MBU0889171.1 hypothetical protein [Alphaproteobacteria bacterium]MBU1812205.1 hypothetical protein [Alphaproteobacteria bacterium]MBU2089492.1 hypothetical protein [Alphaproteobacteria bacterium]
MRFRAVLAGCLLAAFLLPAAPAPAQDTTRSHDWSAYDTANRPIRVSGTIRVLDFTGPNAVLRLETEGRVWRIILPDPTTLRLEGLTPTILTEGKPAVAVGFPRLDDGIELRAIRLTVDGEMHEWR